MPREQGEAAGAQFNASAEWVGMIPKASKEDEENGNTTAFEWVYNQIRGKLASTEDIVLACLEACYKTRALTKQYGAFYFKDNDNGETELCLAHLYRYSNDSCALFSIPIEAVRNGTLPGIKTGVLYDAAGYDRSNLGKYAIDYLKNSEEGGRVPIVHNGLAVGTGVDVQAIVNLDKMYCGVNGDIRKCLSQFTKTGVLTSGMCDNSYAYDMTLTSRGALSFCSTEAYISSRFTGLHILCLLLGIDINSIIKIQDIKIKNTVGQRAVIPQKGVKTLLKVLDGLLDDNEIKLPKMKVQYLPMLQACFIGGCVPLFNQATCGLDVLAKACNWTVNSWTKEDDKAKVMGVWTQCAIEAAGTSSWGELKGKMSTFVENLFMQIACCLYTLLHLYYLQEGNKQILDMSERNAKCKNDLEALWGIFSYPIIRLLTNTLYTSNYDSRLQGTLHYRMLTGSLPSVRGTGANAIGAVNNSGSSNYRGYSYQIYTTEQGNHAELARLLAGDGEANENEVFHSCAKLFDAPKGALNTTRQGYMFNGTAGNLPLVATYTYVFSKEEFEASTLFGYSALDMLKEARMEPSISDCYIGRKLSGSFYSMDLAKHNTISIAAGSRSGKGTVTNCIIASIINSRGSIVYLDGKPDVGGSIMQLGKKLKAPVVVADGYRLPFNNVTDGTVFKTISEVNPKNFLPYDVQDSPLLGENYTVGATNIWGNDKHIALTSQYGFDDDYEQLLMKVVNQSLTTVEAVDSPDCAAAGAHLKLITLMNILESLLSDADWIVVWENYVQSHGIDSKVLKLMNSLKDASGNIASYNIYVFVDEINNVTGVINGFLTYIHNELSYGGRGKVDGIIADRSNNVNECIANVNDARDIDESSEKDSDKRKLTKAKTASVLLNKYQRNLSLVLNVSSMLNRFARRSNKATSGTGISFKYVYVGQQISERKLGFELWSEVGDYKSGGKKQMSTLKRDLGDWAQGIGDMSVGSFFENYVPYYTYQSRNATCKLRGRQYCAPGVFDKNCRVDNLKTTDFKQADKELLNLTGMFKPFEYDEPKELIKSFAVFNCNDVFAGLESATETELGKDIELVVDAVDPYNPDKVVKGFKGTMDSIISLIESEVNKEGPCLRAWLVNLLPSVTHAVTGRSMAVVDDKNRVQNKFKEGWQGVFRGLVSESTICGMAPSMDSIATVPNSAVGFDGFVDKFISTNFTEGRKCTPEELSQRLSTFRKSFSLGAELIRAVLEDIGLINGGMTPYTKVEDWLYDCSTSSFFPFAMGASKTFVSADSDKDEEGTVSNNLTLGNLRELVTKFYTDAKQSSDDNSATGGNDEEFGEVTDFDAEFNIGDEVFDTGDEEEDVSDFEETNTDSEVEEFDYSDFEAENMDTEQSNEGYSDNSPDQMQVVAAMSAINAINATIPLIEANNKLVEQLSKHLNDTVCRDEKFYEVAKTLGTTYLSSCAVVSEHISKVVDYDNNYGVETLKHFGLSDNVLSTFMTYIEAFNKVFEV